MSDWDNLIRLQMTIEGTAQAESVTLSIESAVDIYMMARALEAFVRVGVQHNEMLLTSDGKIVLQRFEDATSELRHALAEVGLKATA